MPVQVLVVDDSDFMRKSIARMIESDPELRVVGFARDGLEGVEQVKKLKPDVVTLDVEMPRLDGLSALRRIMDECPTKVIMCSTMTSKGSKEAIEALRIGAVDFVTKDASHISLKIEQVLKEDLLRKIKAVAQGAGGAERSSAPAVSTAPPPSALRKLGRPDLVVIGSSTGGPPVLETLIQALPATLQQPVVVAQHMPPVFTESLATRLDELCPATVRHADRSCPLESGVVHIVVGGRHGRVVASAGGRLGLEISDEPVEALFKPSVNELFASAARAVGERALAIICTGMGDDGLLGARELARAGAPILAQDEASCVVYGMPRGVVEEKLALAAMPPDLLAATLNRALSGAGARARLAG